MAEIVSLIYVTPLSRLAETLARSQARRLISMLSVGTVVERPSHLQPDHCLQLSMHDITEERDGLVAPSQAQVEALITFARTWDGSAPLVVHCYAGISRSTAAAYAIAAALDPSRDAKDLARELRRLSPSATPNMRIVTLADDLLGRGGELTTAIRMIGRGAEASEGVPFALPVGERRRSGVFGR